MCLGCLGGMTIAVAPGHARLHSRRSSVRRGLRRGVEQSESGRARDAGGRDLPWNHVYASRSRGACACHATAPPLSDPSEQTLARCFSRNQPSERGIACPGAARASTAVACTSEHAPNSLAGDEPLGAPAGRDRRRGAFRQRGISLSVGPDYDARFVGRATYTGLRAQDSGRRSELVGPRDSADTCSGPDPQQVPRCGLSYRNQGPCRSPEVDHDQRQGSLVVIVASRTEAPAPPLGGRVRQLRSLPARPRKSSGGAAMATYSSSVSIRDSARSRNGSGRGSARATPESSAWNAPRRAGD
jgi:hypothetical protein